MIARRISSGLDRRRAIVRICAAGFSALAAHHSFAVRAQGATTFSPPPYPMIFTRRLRRDLGGGLAIEAVRSFEVRFVPNGAGYRIEGREVAVNVTAPPALSKLAEIERNRIETNVFPLQLDFSGRIRSGPKGNMPAPSLAVAADEALKQVSRSSLGGADQLNAQEFMLGLQLVASSLTSNLPANLFRGIVEQERVERQLPLPDGGFGELMVQVSADFAADTHLFQRGERTVVTRIGASERRWVEEWSLTTRSEGGR